MSGSRHISRQTVTMRPPLRRAAFTMRPSARRTNRSQRLAMRTVMVIRSSVAPVRSLSPTAGPSPRRRWQDRIAVGSSARIARGTGRARGRSPLSAAAPESWREMRTAMRESTSASISAPSRTHRHGREIRAAEQRSRARHRGNEMKGLKHVPILRHAEGRVRLRQRSRIGAMTATPPSVARSSPAIHEQRRLAGARGADDSDRVAVGHAEVDARRIATGGRATAMSPARLRA